MARVTSPKSLIAALPEPIQQRLAAIGDGERDLFGRPREPQQIVQAHIDFIETLLAGGVTTAMVGTVLAEVGLARADGSPWPEGTISSAVHRARKLAGAGSDGVPAKPCEELQSAAHHCSALPTPASAGTNEAGPADHCNALPGPAKAPRSAPQARPRKTPVHRHRPEAEAADRQTPGRRGRATPHEDIAGPSEGSAETPPPRSRQSAGVDPVGAQALPTPQIRRAVARLNRIRSSS